MPTASTSEQETAVLGKILTWLLSRAERGVRLDEFALFVQAARATAETRKAVSDALVQAGSPPLSRLTREAYFQLKRTRPRAFESILEALARALGLTLDALRMLFCEKLAWCSRRRGWAAGWSRLTRRIIAFVPRKLQKPVGLLAKATPEIWEVIDIFWKLSDYVPTSLALAKWSLYLAIAGLDWLCGCEKEGKDRKKKKKKKTTNA